MKKLAAAAAILALTCAREQLPSRPPAARPPTSPNLLELTRGAAVVSRSGEALLATSAVRAIDGDGGTAWITPPDSPHQTLVFSLPARARIQQIGITTAAKEPNAIASAKFELSADGNQFVDVGTFSFKPSGSAQLFRITPQIAQYVRVTTLTGHSSYLAINTAHAIGAFVDVPHVVPIEGCWKINGMSGEFAGTRGLIGDFALEGGNNRYVWVRPNGEYGLAFITLTPDGKHLSGIVWHEEAIQAQQFWSDDWLGERCNDVGLEHGLAGVMRPFLDRFGYFPLYALHFDDGGHLNESESTNTLDEIAPLINKHIRFVAHELIRDPNITKTELDTLKAALQKRGINLAGVEFVAMGNRDPRRPAGTDLTRAMYSSVELQIRR